MMMMMMMIFLIQVCFFFFLTRSIISSSSDQSFHESLLIRPLEDGKLHSRFHFIISSASSASTSPSQSTLSSNLRLLQSDLLPISILELIDRFQVSQLSLSLSRGRWEFDRWSSPIDQHWQGYPRGSQLAVRLDSSSNSSEFTNTLAGLFCGSLNRLNLIKNPPQELFSFFGESNEKIQSSPTEDSYHGLLPIEQPCTENLSPLFKLLPCRQYAGLASLINSHQLFDGNWQSLRLKLFKPHQAHSDLKNPLKLEIEIETVLDPVRKTTKRDWSLTSIFGQKIEKNCPLSTSSSIEILDGSLERNDPKPTIEPRAHADGLPIDGKHKYDLLKAVLPFEIEMKWPGEERFQYPKKYSTPSVMIKRLILGHGQNRGWMGVEIGLSQAEISKNQSIIYYEGLPWWLSIYLHTLKVKVDGVSIDPKEVIIEKAMKPSLQRERHYTFSYKLKVPSPAPPSSSASSELEMRKIEMIFEYEKDLLLYTEYASDANRGFDLNPAALILHPPGLARRPLSVWTPCALVDLATPDFSMPYNVIIVTSTAMALFFGSVFNLLVRDFRLVRLARPPAKKP